MSDNNDTLEQKIQVLRQRVGELEQNQFIKASVSEVDANDFRGPGKTGVYAVSISSKNTNFPSRCKRRNINSNVWKRVMGVSRNEDICR